MKKLILIVGPNGVGKTTTAKILLQKLSKCAYVDADWCRAINPFPFTDATKYAVTRNIYSLFKNYLLCEDILLWQLKIDNAYGVPDEYLVSYNYGDN